MEQSLLQGDYQQGRFNELSWLGGIVDGEGSVLLSKDIHRKFKCVHPRMTITNTEPKMINKIIEILKKYYIPHHIRMRSPKKGQSIKRLGKPYLPLTEIRIEGFRRLKKFLPLIKSYLISKREKADLLEEFIDSRLSKLGNPIPYNEKEKNLCLKIWRLNGNYSIHLNEFKENPQRLNAEPNMG